MINSVTILMNSYPINCYIINTNFFTQSAVLIKPYFEFSKNCMITSGNRW